MALNIREIEGRDLFVGSVDDPLQVIAVVVSGARPGSYVEAECNAGSAWGTADDQGNASLEVPWRVTGAPGTYMEVHVSASSNGQHAVFNDAVLVYEPGWTVHLVSHFHYDPVWWNTQAGFLDDWLDLGPETAPGRMPGTQLGFDLVRTHLRLALLDPDYRFVLAETDYLKPYWDGFPEERSLLRHLLEAGRIELVGAMYNEPSTNLTGSELTIRNIVYGLALQGEVMPGAPQTAWQLDVFGHDPQFPGLLEGAGVTSSSWARGPFHEWGPMQTPGEKGFHPPHGMQFPSEFEWVSPSGRGVLTSYMAAHYSAGWWMDAAPSLREAEAAVHELYTLLKPVSITRNVLLPVGTDHVRPNRWLTRIHRDWKTRYVWPKFEVALPREYFSLVRNEIDARGLSLPVQTRDMNPIFTGKDVSYIDTKQAQRAAEEAVIDAEKWAALAQVHVGAPYPHADLDGVWRQLMYGAHHDAITGSESDQVYLDLLSSWRDAWTTSEGLKAAALTALASSGISSERAAGDPPTRVVVFNSLSWTRADLVTFEVPSPSTVETVEGQGVNSTCEQLASGAFLLQFVAEAVPSLGYRQYLLREVSADQVGWSTDSSTSISNQRFSLSIDPEHGGAIVQLIDRRDDTEIVGSGGRANELLLYDEYPEHPVTKLGPWQLLPRGGPLESSASRPAVHEARRSGVGEQLVVRGTLGDVSFTQTISLWKGLDRVDCETRIEDFAGSDQLIRLRWNCPVPGALPLYEVADAVIARGFGHPNSDAVHLPHTLDNPSHNWFGLGHSAILNLRGADGSLDSKRSIGTAEIISADNPEAVSLAGQLARALIRVGVTATTSTAPWPRYGNLVHDSNIPDVRFALGGPETNAFTAELVSQADPAIGRELEQKSATVRGTRMYVPAVGAVGEVWRADANVTGARDVGVVVIASQEVAATVADVCLELRSAELDVWAAPSPLPPTDFELRTVAILNRGTPGSVVTVDGALYMSLMRSCTGWPSGVWIDPPRRTTPDGSGFQLQHWTHAFRYALSAGPGGWREADVTVQGHEFNHPFEVVVDRSPCSSPESKSLLSFEPERAVIVTALKAAGYPCAGASRQPSSDLALRVYEPAGGDAEFTVSLAAGIRAIRSTDLLEREIALGDQPKPSGSTLQVSAADHGTFLLTPQSQSLRSAADPYTHEVGPQFSRYWDHNAGPAPAGNMPLSVHIRPQEPGTNGDVNIVVSVAGRPGSRVSVSLGAPPGWRVKQHLEFDLGNEGWASVPLKVVKESMDFEGDLVLTAVASDGRVDVVDSRVFSPSGWPVRRSDLQATLTSQWLDDVVVVRAGQRNRVHLVIRNRAAHPVVGKAQLLSPWGTWEMCRDWQDTFAVEAESSSSVVFDMAPPASGQQSQSWALVKLMWHGACHYSPAIAINVQ